MEIKKETKVVVKTTDGSELNKGDTCIFAVNGNIGMFGTFIGFSRKGAMEFEVDEYRESFTFAVMPKSIRWIFKAEINSYTSIKIRA